jgi:cytochrome c oxidase cbb3-type subunit 4
MDINDFRSWHTILLMVLFIGIVVWAYGKKRKKSFDEAANLPFADESLDEATMKKEKDHE